MPEPQTATNEDQPRSDIRSRASGPFSERDLAWLRGYCVSNASIALLDHCGTTLREQLLEAGYDPHPVDISSEHLGRLAGGSADRVLVLGGLDSAEGEREAVAEISRIAAPGALVAVLATDRLWRISEDSMLTISVDTIGDQLKPLFQLESTYLSGRTLRLVLRRTAVPHTPDSMTPRDHGSLAHSFAKMRPASTIPAAGPVAAAPHGALETGVLRLLAQRELWRTRAEVANWKLRRLRERRWWRLGAILGRVRRSPRELIRLPGDLWGLTTDRADPEPRPSSRPVPPLPAWVRTPTGIVDRRSGMVRPRLEMPPIPQVPMPHGPVQRPDLRVAAILDEFSRLAFSYEATLTDLTPTNWREVLADNPDLLLVESAWRGLDDAWRKQIASEDGPSEEFRQLVGAFRDAGIPTVFWNKEDPPNYRHFISSAALFDQVFTVDRNCLPAYRRDLEHDRIDILPFGVQPRIHNPIEVPGGREHPVAFAGTYYSRKHPHRKVQMFQVVDPARAHGLHIYSRVSGDRNYDFPPPLDEHVVGTLPYERILSAYKRYKVFLNVNSVVDSDTMCARRIFELLGCGTTVLSGTSPAIQNLLGTGFVFESSDPEETDHLLEQLLEDDDLRARTAVRGVRRVLSEHTYGHRIARVLGSVAMPDPLHPAELVGLLQTGHQHQAERLLLEMGHQTRVPDRMILVDEGRRLDHFALNNTADSAGLPALDVVDEDEFQVLLNREPGLGNGLVALLSEVASYGPEFLRDAAQAQEFADADAWGKATHYTYEAGTLQLANEGHENRFVELLVPGSVVTTASYLGQSWDDAKQGLLSFSDRIRDRGARLYATHRFNFTPHAGTRGSQAEVEETPAWWC